MLPTRTTTGKKGEILKNKNKKKKKGTKEFYLNTFKKEYPNRKGTLCINYNRKDENTYVFYWDQRDYFTEFHNRNLLHPIPKINTLYFVSGLRLRQAFRSAFRQPKLGMSYSEKQNITGHNNDYVPIGDGFKYYNFLVDLIPPSAWPIIKQVVIEEKPTEQYNWRLRQSLMSLLSDGLASLFDFFYDKNPRSKSLPSYVN